MRKLKINELRALINETLFLEYDDDEATDEDDEKYVDIKDEHNRHHDKHKRTNISFGVKRSVNDVAISLFANVQQLDPNTENELQVLEMIGSALNELLDGIKKQLLVRGYEQRDIANFKDKIKRKLT